MSSMHQLESLKGPIAAVQRLIARFNDRGIIIGGVAASVLGMPRFTADADAMLLLSLDELGLLLKLAREEGLTVDIQPVADRRENILISWGTDSYLSGKHGLLLHGHYDTVPALDMPQAFDVKIRDGLLWGRGSVDQKGGLVAALAALMAMKRLGRPMKRSLCLAAVVDEDQAVDVVGVVAIDEAANIERIADEPHD